MPQGSGFLTTTTMSVVKAPTSSLTGDFPSLLSLFHPITEQSVLILQRMNYWPTIFGIEQESKSSGCSTGVLRRRLPHLHPQFSDYPKRSWNGLSPTSFAISSHLEKPSRLSDTIGSYFHLSGIIHQVSRHLSVIAPFDGFSASAASIGHSQSPYETTCTTCPAIPCLPVLDRSFFLSVGVPRHVCFPSSHHRPSA